MPLSLEDWDRRFIHQANWSRALRDSCNQDFPLSPFSKILEVGSGTGAVASTILKPPGSLVIGIDIDLDRLAYSQKKHAQIQHSGANGSSLPFQSGEFDQCFCHYLLLWVADPLSVVKEMKRVTRKGGMVFLFSEPDYGGRIDYPDELTIIKEMQIRSLAFQGADPFLGRRLPRLLHVAGLQSIHSGMLAWSGQEAFDEDSFNSEWEIINSDLSCEISSNQLQNYQSMDRKAWLEGLRVLFVPVFYGWGTV